jgi:hypothetical protein
VEYLDDDPSWWDEDHILMALQLGYDESGHGDTLLVSVQVGIVEPAKRLKRQWRNRLGPLPFFHSVDFGNATKGIFSDAGFDPEDRRELLKDLSGLIHRCLSVGMTAKISKSLYEQKTTAKFRSQHGAAYCCCINSLLLLVYVWAKKLNIKPEVNIIIEGGHNNAAQSVSLLNQWKDAPPVPHLDGLKILNVGLGRKEDHPILQAADMLAYCKKQHLCNGDREIYDALHRKGSLYKPIAVTLDEKHMQAIQEGPLKWAQERMDDARRRHRENEERGDGIRKIRSNDADPDESSALGDKGGIGSGEDSEEEIKAEG